MGFETAVFFPVCGISLLECGLPLSSFWAGGSGNRYGRWMGVVKCLWRFCWRLSLASWGVQFPRLGSDVRNCCAVDGCFDVVGGVADTCCASGCCPIGSLVSC